jgi:hypothetical protein
MRITYEKIVFGGELMRLDQYSSKRNPRPGFPTPDEIKRTTQAWTGEAKQEIAEKMVNEEAEKICHR